MSTLKPPLTFEYQVQKLKSKGFDIKDEAGVLDFLKAVNYYRFSAYLLPFCTSTNVYEINIPIEKPIAIYNFDFEMRNILFAAIQKIEIEVKTSITYFFSHKYGALGYYNKNNFNSYHKAEIYKEKIIDILNKHKKSLVIKHHNNNYNKKIPFWAIIDFFTFSQVSIFFADMKNKDKKLFIHEHYNGFCNIHEFENWMRCISELRNMVAHFSRIYYVHFNSAPTFSNRKKMPNPSRMLFSQIVVLKLIMKDKNYWNKTICKHICDLVYKYKNEIDLNHIGFNDNFENLLRY